MAPKTKLIRESKIDLACGQHKRDGYFGIDYVKTDASDYVHDLTVYPWPIADGVVEELHSSHYVEHIPMVEIDGQDALFRFMDEAYRILRKPKGEPGDDDYVPGGEFLIIHPYLKSVRAFQDPTHRRFIPEHTWGYFNRDWRVANGLDHYKVACDFDVVTTTYVGIPDDVSGRNEHTKMLMLSRDWEVIADLHVLLRAR